MEIKWTKSDSRKFECKHEIVRQGMKTTVEINDGNRKA